MLDSQNKADHEATNTTHAGQEPKEGITMESHWSGTKGSKSVILSFKPVFLEYITQEILRERQ